MSGIKPMDLSVLGPFLRRAMITTWICQGQVPWFSQAFRKLVSASMPRGGKYLQAPPSCYTPAAFFELIASTASET